MQSPLYFDIDSEYDYFYRNTGTKGHRTDIYPRIYLLMKHKNYFTLEPSLGLRATAWHLETDARGSSGQQRTLLRELYDVELDLFSELVKIYPVNIYSIDRLKHSLRPQITYNYTPNLVQDKYPSFDAIDRIAENNTLTYSLTNFFTSRTPKAAPPSSEQGIAPPTYDYRRIGRLKLEQSYDINKENQDDPEPFSPVGAELEINALKYLTLLADAQWSPYSHDLNSHNAALSLANQRGDQLSLEHRYTRFTNESIYGNLHLEITDRLSAFADYERNLLTEQKIATGAGMHYRFQCWSIEFRYNEEGEAQDRKYLLMINLSGLGSIGI